LITTRDTALKTQVVGLVPVLIQAGQKKPVEFQWQDKRYKPDDLNRRFDNNPHFNVGLLLGPAGGVIDIECDDPRSPIDKEELFAGVDKPKTVSYTSRRGNHELYKWNDRLAAIGKAKFNWKTVEIRLGTGNKAAQSLLPPSQTDGFTREWINDLDTPLAELPDIVIERLIEAAAKPEPTESAPRAKSDSVEEDFCQRGEWKKILEPHGWTYQGTTDIGEQWRRPGKSEGLSAAVVKSQDGRELLHVFTTNAPPFAGDTNYNKLTAFALLNHNGDAGAARQDLARSGFGKFTIPWMNCVDLENNSFDQEFLIENTMVARQPMIFAGEKKSLKTTFLIDMAIALATGAPYLGKFKVRRTCKVAVMSGESGMATIKETAQRVAKSGGQSLSAIGDQILWTEWLPKFDSPDHRGYLADALTTAKIEVLVIDPAYLTMPGADAGNVFKQGELLRGVTDICRENGVAMVLAHHTRKRGNASKDRYLAPELDDITWSGFSEFARQWILLGRREKFEGAQGEDREHKLWMNVGGSAGHGAIWAVDVNEGVFEEGKQRLYQVKVFTPTEAKYERKEQKKDDIREKLLNVMRSFPDGETQTVLCDAAGIRNDSITKALFEAMHKEGIIEVVKVKKGNGRAHVGYRLNTKGQL
jgi:hypothetical protein